MTEEQVDLTKLDCKIFVDGVRDASELSGWLALAITGDRTEDGVQAPLVEMLVEDNKDADAIAKQTLPSGFLFFDHFVEVYFAPRADHDHRVREVSRVLEDLWGRDLAAVAACDYEDELPRQGGVDGSGPGPVNG